jgi:hypothetical protein
MFNTHFVLGTHESLKRVMTMWQDHRIQATVREFDEEGVDSENSPFSGLAIKEAIQTVRDGMHNRDLLEEGQGGENPHPFETR